MVLSIFSHAYVLNEPHVTGRMRKVEARLRRLKVDYEVFPAISSNSLSYQRRLGQISPGAYACAVSHAALLELIIQRGHESTLILEDDVVFRDDIPEIMYEVSDECAQQDWDILYLGLDLRISADRLSRHLGRVKTGFHAHAYAVSKKGAPKVAASINNTLRNPIEPFDCFRDNSLVKLYTIPILAVQEPDYSSTYTKYIDRLPQYFSVFNGEEFESNCFELQAMRSDWREVLSFRRLFDAAQQARRSGLLEDAACNFRAAITVWPRFSTLLACEVVPLSVTRVIENRDTLDSDIIEAFRWLAKNASRLLPGYF